MSNPPVVLVTSGQVLLPLAVIPNKTKQNTKQIKKLFRKMKFIPSFTGHYYQIAHEFKQCKKRETRTSGTEM
jgi:ribosomal protein S19